MSTSFDTHARAINQPTLELIADILDKHTNGVLAGAREHIEQRKRRRKADEALLRQCWDALDELMHSNSTKAAQQKYLMVTDALQERLK